MVLFKDRQMRYIQVACVGGEGAWELSLPIREVSSFQRV